MNRELAKSMFQSIFLGGLVFIILAFGTFQANASGFNQSAAQDGKLSEIMAIKKIS